MKTFLKPESSFQKSVDGPKVGEEHHDVAHFAADKLEKVPAVVMQDGLEIFDVFFNDRLQNYAVVVLVVFLQHDGGPGVVAEGSDQSSFDGFPDFVGEKESSGLEEKHERHPLVVRSIWRVVS